MDDQGEQSEGSGSASELVQSADAPRVVLVIITTVTTSLEELVIWFKLVVCGSVCFSAISALILVTVVVTVAVVIIIVVGGIRFGAVSIIKTTTAHILRAYNFAA